MSGEEARTAARTSSASVTAAENAALDAAAPFALVVVDAHHRLTRFNDLFVAAAGLNRDEMLGRTFAEVLPNLASAITPLLANAIEHHIATLELEVTEVDAQLGSERDWLMSCHPVVVDHGVVGAVLIAVDDTARNQAAVHTRFDAELLSAGDQAVVAIDLHQVITYWNEAAETMYGWTRNEAIGRNLDDLLGRDEPPERLAEIADRLNRGEIWTGEYEIRRRDGSMMAAQITNRPVYDVAGRLSAVIGVSEDITERRRNEETLRLLSAIVDGSGDAIIGLDVDGIISTWNAAAESLFGYSAHEAKGQPIALIADENRVTEQVEMRGRLLAGGHSEHIETVRRRKDGAQVEVGLTTSTIKDASGAVVGLSVIAQDISEQLASQRALEASARHLAEAQRTAHLGSFDFRIASGELTWSDECCRILGFDVSVVPSTELFSSHVHPDDRALVRHTLGMAARQGTPFEQQFRVERSDGTRVVRARSTPEIGPDGEVIAVAGTLMDETDRVEAERVRRAAETRFEIGFEQSAVGAVIADMDGIPSRVNGAACVILGRPVTELVGRRWIEFTHPDDDLLGVAASAWFALGHETFRDDRRYVRPDGSDVWVATNLTIVRDESGEPEYVFMQLQDITERKEMEQDLAHLALHDSLTGLPNRALLTDRLNQGLAAAERRGTSLGVIFLDVDRFKVLNDSLGHSAGDELLKHVATRAAAAIRPGDTVARFGGDEFVVVCDDVSPEDIDTIARRILSALGAPLRIGDHSVHLSASLGIAMAERGSTPEGLLRDSDAAMYQAKERGRGRMEVFDSAMRDDVERQLTTASAIRTALENNEFVVHYQPIIDTFSGALLSVEALVRWHRPNDGLIGPDLFISVAEETGLIVPLGAWVLERACEDLVTWQQIQPSLTVAVNMSVRQMLGPGMCETIEAIFDRTGVRPADVSLELTESMFMEDVDFFGQILSTLKGFGAHLSIDDFGTGYSSLSYLRQFPVDGVKVDRAFVQRINDGPHDLALVAAIVAMAQALNLEVTAEGIETHDQLLALQSLGVRRAQGFYFARPMDRGGIENLLISRVPWDVVQPGP